MGARSPPRRPRPSSRRCCTASRSWPCGSSARSSTPTTAASSSTTGGCTSELQAYIGAFNPELADRVEFYDAEAEGLSLFEQYHVHEQVHKALDRKVWLPSGGSLIIEHTEALTVIDVNTGKNVGTSNLEETVFHNNLEAADEIAKQLRLRDIGGIIVIDFIDMENRDNRAKVVERVPQRAVPGQDPVPGVRHLRARPRRDDPQAHRRGPAHRVLRDLPELRGPRRHRRPRRCSTDGDRCRDGRGGSGGSELGSPIAMYAVIGTGAGQDKVAEGQQVARRPARRRRRATRSRLTAKMVVDGDTVLATPDQLEGVTVTGRVVGEAKGPKINGFTYKKRTNQRRRYGHRQRYTVVEITKIARVGGRAMSKTKGGGSTRNGRDSNAQRLGVKAFGGTAGERRHDHRPPARHQVPPRQERRHRRRRHAVLARRRRGQVRPAQGPQGRRRRAGRLTDLPTSPDTIRAHVVVSGRVQGVWFRDACRREAQARDVTGFVKNRNDGTVEAVFEGAAPAVAECVAWCRIGPQRADVTGIEVVEEPAVGLVGFHIR